MKGPGKRTTREMCGYCWEYSNPWPLFCRTISELLFTNDSSSRICEKRMFWNRTWHGHVQDTKVIQLFLVLLVEMMFLISHTCIIITAASPPSDLSALLPHAPGLHPLHPLHKSSLNDFPLLALLGVFKVASVAKFHEVTRFVHLAFEATEGRLNGFPFPDFDLNVNRKGSGDSCE